MNKTELRRINHENRRNRFVTEVANKIKDEVTQLLIDIMREEFRIIIREEMRKVVREELASINLGIQRKEQFLPRQVELTEPQHNKQNCKSKERCQQIQSELKQNMEKQSTFQVGLKESNIMDLDIPGPEVLQVMLFNLESEARDGLVGEGNRDIHPEN